MYHTFIYLLLISLYYLFYKIKFLIKKIKFIVKKELKNIHKKCYKIIYISIILQYIYKYFLIFTYVIFLY